MTREVVSRAPPLASTVLAVGSVMTGRAFSVGLASSR